MEESDFNFNVLIVGLGLIGGSYAKALRELKPKNISGIDTDETTLNDALRMGIIDEGFKNGDIALRHADIIVIALYPQDTIKFIENNIGNFKAGAVITDTCSVKQMIVDKINYILPETIEFVGGHPMAGKETYGLQASSKDIFLDTNYIITPQIRNTEKNLCFIEKIAKAIGCSNVVRVDPEVHDRIIAFTSQLPHVIAVALMNSDICCELVNSFIGGSFKDATRVATINSKLWVELFTLNSDRIIDEIESFEESLLKIKVAIQSQDEQALKNFFNNSDKKRRMMF